MSCYGAAPEAIPTASMGKFEYIVLEMACELKGGMRMRGIQNA